MRAKEFISEVGINAQRSFKGSPCTKDCSGHTAGYNWAKKKKVRNSNQCPNDPNRPSFSNGCKIAGSETQNP